VDARKCISYQTIELKSGPDKNLKGRFKNRVFGCDICQDVCPWNRKSVPNKEPGFIPSAQFLNLTKEEWYDLNKIRFNRIFKKSAVKRAGFEEIKRNLDFIKDSPEE
jgi:epoxyqueuosine reductase